MFYTLYFLTPKKLKNLTLLLFSLIFYFWGEPVYTLLLLFSIFTDFIFGKLIHKSFGTPNAKFWLICSITLNLTTLSFFKYTDFFIRTINDVLKTNIPLTNVPLPLGISFFAFQTMSYTIDLYRGKAKVQNHIVPYATYVSMFPQLVAGPIVRYTSVANELNDRKHTILHFSNGISRFVVGLAKKVLLANQLGELSKILQNSMEQSIAIAWLGTISYALQIYFDFSGYSDMAIGLGKTLGFRFLENFEYPFISKSISEFWRRWHISLGTWFKEYLYIPLGGNRVSRLKWFRNIFIVWFLTGFWHGANWNFIFWGIYFGLILVFEKFFLLKWFENKPAFIAHIYTIFLVLIGFTIFEYENLSAMQMQLQNMFFLGNVTFSGVETAYYLRSFFVLLIVSVFGATPIPKKIALYVQKKYPYVSAVLESIMICILLLLSTAYLIDSSFNPFLYFRF